MMETDRLLTFNNRVRILGTSVQAMGSIIDDGDLGMTALNGLPDE